MVWRAHPKWRAELTEWFEDVRGPFSVLQSYCRFGGYSFG